MMKKEKPMMSVTDIIQGAQAQHWARGIAGWTTNQCNLIIDIDSIRFLLFKNFDYTKFIFKIIQQFL